MNREQRRREQFKKGAAGQLLKPCGQLAIDYGHDGRVVLVLLTKPVDNLALSEAQVDGMITGLQTAKAALIAHKAAAAAQGGPGNA